MSIIFYLIVQFILLKGEIIVDETNCRNNKILEANCKFNVVLKGLTLDKMECTLRFKVKNFSAVEYSSVKITLMQEAEGKCPIFYLNITSADNKKKELTTTCGGFIIPINHTFDRFKSAYFLYDNRGLYDNSSNINITFVLVEKKGNICFEQDQKFSLRPWQIVLIVVFVLFLMFLIILSPILIIRKIPKKKGSNEVPVEEGSIMLNDGGNQYACPESGHI